MPPIDLNLLAVFDALHELRSVTRAAQRLNITQSAVSHALRRLRVAIGDPLFVRHGNRLQPTARAQDMAQGVSEGLGRLRAAMLPAQFDPTTAQRTFTVAAGSYFCALLIPRLVARARQVAPGLRFRVVPIGSDLLARLDEGVVELALGAFDHVPRRLDLTVLFREDLVWIASRSNPIGRRRLTTADLLHRPHLVIATRREFEPVQALLAEGPLESRLADRSSRSGQADDDPVPAVVYDALTAAAVVAQTDLIALVPRRLARNEESRLALRILETDEDSSGMDLGMLTHDRTAADPGVAWLRAELAQLSG